MTWRTPFTLALGLLLLTGCNFTRPIHYRVSSNFSVADPQFVQTMSNLLGPPLVGGNKITTYVNGDQIFPAMLTAIHSAKNTIDLESYIYWSGHVGSEFTDALSERARAGVKVHLLIDGIGGDKLSRGYYKEMQDAGVEVHRYHAFYPYDIYTYTQINHRTHRKLLVVDGIIGFTGGVGIADLWDGHAQDPNHWRDDHYRIDGPGVAQIQAAFADNWMQTTGVVLEGDHYFPNLESAGDEYTQVFKSSPTGGAESMQLMMLMFLAHAQKSIRIESAYFVPNPLIRDALEKAAQRGVDVQVIVPGPHIDKQFVLSASRASWGHMLKAGVKIYEYQPTMLHCKLLIIDELWTSIGSSNIDERSFRLNDEANLNVLNPNFAAEQNRIFEMDKAQSHLITSEAWHHRALLRRFLDRISTLLDLEL
jgi:cardiolipin synthase